MKTWSRAKLAFISVGLLAIHAANSQDVKLGENELYSVIDVIKSTEPPKHILMYHPWSTKSHMMQQTALLRGLLAKGYVVTAVFPHPTNLVQNGYTEVVVEDVFYKISKVMLDSMIDQDTTSIWSFLRLVPKITKMMNDEFQGVRDLEEMLIKDLSSQSKSVDALIFTSQFGFTATLLYAHYQCPLVSMSPPGWASRITKHSGNSENPAYQPDQVIPAIEPLTFSQRLVNTVFYAILDFDTFGWIWFPLIIDYELFDIDGYRKILENMSLILMCSHFVTQSPRALTANTVEVGGIHCREGQPLPEDLQMFLDGHPEGVVYVSFGSSVKPSQMKAEQKQVFLDTFHQLRHPVIWKWDEDNIPNLPPNVKLSKWLPQQDLLAHPNLRVFVTHGGLLSVQEALYHRTPLVGIPLGNDQKPNLMRAEKRGYAIMLDWISLSSEQLVTAINRTMNDEEMKKNMEEMHELFVDARDTPLDRAVWWVEYVIRHEGAQFLKPHSLDLAWYQYHLLDVIAFLLFILAASTLLIFKCFMCFFRCCCFRKLKKE